MVAPSRARPGERMWRRKVRAGNSPVVFFRVLSVWFLRLFLTSSTWIRGISPSRSCAVASPLLLLSPPGDWHLGTGSLFGGLGLLVFLLLLVSSRSLLLFGLMRVFFLAAGEDSRSLHLLSLDLVRIRPPPC
jgi:hypothetical protein